MNETVFALLDDAAAPDAAPRSRLYTGWRAERRCEDPAMLASFWLGVAGEIAQGARAVVLADYEWGVRLARAGAGHGRWQGGAAGALRVLLFDRCERLDSAAVEAWLAAQEGQTEPAPAGVVELTSDTTDADYVAAIDDIHALIRAGETYQVNHTVRWHGRCVGTPLALYRRLRAHQPVAFGALIALPGDRWVLSCSPELFAAHEDGQLVTRPMKGTAPRHADAQADRDSAAWLAGDPKNRAENLMIVDLLRNDLGRLAVTGSVRVPQLFAIEPYRTVYQMTSTVSATLPPAVTFPEVLRALFPCGSITGAPKHHTMELIERLETSPRGLYTGAIGWLDAPAGEGQGDGAGRVLGDFCLSVAIRTLLLGPARASDESRPVTLGVGGGIVLDSVAAQEAAECRLKARFVSRAEPGFTLFETVRIEAGQALRLDAHLRRMAGSATALGFEFDAAAVRRQVDEAVDRLDPQAVHRLRIDLWRDGRTALRSGLLAPLQAQVVSLLWPGAPLFGIEAALLAHKTSLRGRYDAAIRAAEEKGAFDQLFVNPAGRLTEGARSTLLVRLDGRWFTPPLTSGALPGVMRAALFEDPTLGLCERVLQPADLSRAEALAVCNALRGMLPARMISE